MRLGKLILRIVPAGIVLCCLRASPQQPHSSSAASGGEGRLTVTATVVSSVGLVTGPDGEPKLVYANSVDPRDNVSHLDTVVVKLTPVAAEPQKPARKKSK